MKTAETRPGGPVFPWLYASYFLSRLIKLFDEKLQDRRVDQRLMDEVIRLAETSPHLLADIGVDIEIDDNSR